MIYLGADHAGFELKEEIKKYLVELGFEVQDLGAYRFDQKDDYPDFVTSVAQKVALPQGHLAEFSRSPQVKDDVKGIVFGGSGQGEAIATNKVKGIRAAVYYGGPLDIIKLSRQHNNANILSLGARFLSRAEALEAVKLFLETPFEGGRHQPRIDKIDKLLN